MTEQPVEQRSLVISDPQVMRALAHPARVEIMEHLSSTDTAITATECAEIVGLSPSATSYHLRELARFGLVEQAPSRGDARERLWRSSVRSFGVEAGPDSSQEARAAQETLIEVYAARDYQRIRAWARRLGDESKEWYDATAYGGSVLMLTAEELTTLNAAVRELMKPYRRRDRTEPPEGARPVAAHYMAMPID
ncbi:winged helix-turn-helix domain-containing protein [Plantactinospora sp. B5E13]|uniref:ArsR/SmtB family transcription factor n=1 Tax=unclassified Plantactinospora TaxID=2631981 RepID=UPI00325C8934